MNPVVMILTGWAGTGKTRLLELFRAEHPGSVQIVTPDQGGQVFDPGIADWASHAAIALDEVCMWERASVVAGIAALEAYAADNGKQLILVTQCDDDLQRFGIHLQTTPLTVRLEGRQQAITIAYDGKHRRFTADMFAAQGAE